MNTNDILALVNSIQPTAQANLPVIPNNGNPGGAYNMPAMPYATSAPTPQAPVLPASPVAQPAGHMAGGLGGGIVDRYPWMQQSPHMDWIQQWLGNRQYGIIPRAR